MRREGDVHAKTSIGKFGGGRGRCGDVGDVRAGGGLCYPWCVQGRGVGYPGDCSYTSYKQCMASASGRYAYCGVNPYVAFGAQGSPQPRGRHYYHHHYYYR
ncbi:MAG TPA: DUF3551 domain-containing protein [Bradyrhizobium sp.]|uniref:DUF3551 domain-containing protein n=1 Tax=Bradyrhizobium sp. TaxID=376 RepID=UPI002C3E5F55|nr:DUF3551 domain-containing protein [Bradyrhizobium sp.]HLZ04186.1 DUF3551 domain-containing protein [Bradyrhizobium sp.]